MKKATTYTLMNQNVLFPLISSDLPPSFSTRGSKIVNFDSAHCVNSCIGGAFDFHFQNVFKSLQLFLYLKRFTPTPKVQS